MNFDQFFQAATGLDSPLDYQRRLAEDLECKSRLVNILTGFGKTAIVVSASRTDSSRGELAWLWNRVTYLEALLRAADGRASELLSKWISAEEKYGHETG